MSRILGLIFIGILFTTCKTKQAAVGKELTVDMSPKIIFLTYKYENKVFVLSNKIVAEGNLKVQGSGIDKYEEGDVIFKQVNAKGDVLHSQRIENPFEKVVEFADDNGVFHKKVVSIENPEINLRTKLFPGAAFLKIEQYNEDQSKVKILSNTEI